MLGLNLKLKNCLIQSKPGIQRHIIAGVDSSVVSSPNLEELDCPIFSSVFNQLFANAIAQQAILPQAISIWSSKSSLHLYIVKLKSRLRTELG